VPVKKVGNDKRKDEYHGGDDDAEKDVNFRGFIHGFHRCFDSFYVFGN
jgi:hypothetical protein